MLDILTFLSNNKVVILGAATVVAELIVIIFNTIRKIRSNNMYLLGVAETTNLKDFLWIINPINVFRKP